MKKDMQKRVKENKQRAAELIQYANPKSKNIPSIERVTEILLMNIPYRSEHPSITNINITEYHKNDIIKSAHFEVQTADGKTFKIDAYQHLKGRTQDEIEADKTRTFPSGLFNIFHSEIA